MVACLNRSLNPGSSVLYQLSLNVSSADTRTKCVAVRVVPAVCSRVDRDIPLKYYKLMLKVGSSQNQDPEFSVKVLLCHHYVI